MPSTDGGKYLNINDTFKERTTDDLQYFLIKTEILPNEETWYQNSLLLTKPGCWKYEYAKRYNEFKSPVSHCVYIFMSLFDNLELCVCVCVCVETNQKNIKEDSRDGDHEYTGYVFV